MIKYFSDIELGEKDRTIDEINREMHEAIISIYKKYANKKSFFESAGQVCPCGQSVCAFNEGKFLILAAGEIPDFQLEYSNGEDNPFFDEDNSSEYDKYKILDFIQFCYKNLKKAKLLEGSKCTDPFNTDFPEFHHYIFEDCDTLKECFRNDINTIFSRNGIVFELKETGEIKRSVPGGIVPLISKLYITDDDELNTLVNEAFENFLKVQFEDRRRALEKIWDAFERMKTYYSDMKKNKSIEKLIKKVSSDNNAYGKLLDDESTALTKIGNDFRIRHHETDKYEIEDNNQIDYFFYRMVSFMALFLKYLEKDK